MRVDGSLQIPPRSSLIGHEPSYTHRNCLPMTGYSTAHCAPHYSTIDCSANAADDSDERF
jgi:hypothetical protein